MASVISAYEFIIRQVLSDLTPTVLNQQKHDMLEREWIREMLADLDIEKENIDPLIQQPKKQKMDVKLPPPPLPPPPTAIAVPLRPPDLHASIHLSFIFGSLPQPVPSSVTVTISLPTVLPPSPPHSQQPPLQPKHVNSHTPPPRKRKNIDTFTPVIDLLRKHKEAITSRMSDIAWLLLEDDSDENDKKEEQQPIVSVKLPDLLSSTNYIVGELTARPKSSSPFAFTATLNNCICRFDSRELFLHEIHLLSVTR